MLCRNCGIEFEPKKRGRKNTGFCCKHCADSWRQHNVYDLLPKKYQKVCGCCGKLFETNRVKQKYCGKSCSSKERLEAHHHVQSCKNCGKEFVADQPSKAYCSDECAIYMNKIRYQHKKQKRREMTGEYKEQFIKLSEVYHSAHGICAICGLPVPFTGERNGMWSATRDHIIPLSKAGEHTYGNCQLAHRICNSCKGTEQKSFHIDWEKRVKEEPEKWEKKLEYLRELLECDNVQHKAG